MSRRTKWIIRAACCALILLCAVLFRGALLTGIAELWIVEEPVTRADAVLVMGGGVNTRTFAAAELYHAGQSPRVLVTRCKPDPVEKLGLVKSHTELCREVVLAKGVPMTSLETIGRDVSSSREEALALKVWAQQTGARTILVPTEFLYTRRMRWLFDRTFRDTGVRIVVHAIDPLDYTRSDWWQHEEGLIAFQNEVIKYLYYRLNY